MALTDEELRIKAAGDMGVPTSEVLVLRAWDGTPSFSWRGMEWRYIIAGARPFVLAMTQEKE